MKSVWMMRPQKDGDAVSGPFVEGDHLKALLSEMGRLAVQAGGHLCAFFPDRWHAAPPARLAFDGAAERWRTTFCGGDSNAGSRESPA